MDRPKIKVPLQQLDIILELITISLLLTTCAYTIVQYSNLPETVPTHFNAAGEADDFGHKSSIFIIPGIGIALYLLLFILNKYPHMHNYMVNITEENALKNYRFSNRVLRFVNLFCAALMAYITYIIVKSSEGQEFTIGQWFLPVIIGSSVVLPIVLFIYMRKLNT
jgi:uncharacterized membrane protein